MPRNSKYPIWVSFVGVGKIQGPLEIIRCSGIKDA